MKLSRQKREELLSAAIINSLALIALCSFVFALTAFAADPSWWSSPGSGTQSAVASEQVVTNDGVVSTNYITNNYAVVVQGQLKQFTARAVDELNSNLTGGAGSNLNNLVQGWAQDYATNNYSDPTNAYAPYNPKDFTVMTAGQLKYIGNMVWSRLVAEGYTNALPAWLDTNSSDTQLANIGQLKQVFDFNLLPQTPTSVTVYQDGTQATINWSDTSGNLTGFTLQESTDGGTTWTNAGTFSGSTTSATITGLDSGTTYDFRVIASNSSGSSAPSSTATTTLTAPTVVITALIASPTDGSTIYTGNNFQFTVNASTSAGTIQQVNFYADSVYLGTSTTFPYTLSVPSLAAGTHQLEATVETSLGNALLVTSTVTSVDALDSNGLPYAWELKYFGQTGIDPNADPDGDGISNMQEYLDGTDPTDYYNGQAVTLAIVQGDDQTAWTGRYLDQSLQVKVTEDGTALVNAPVQFNVGGGSGLLQTDLGQPMAQSIKAVTDSDGIATIYYYQASDFSGTATVTATAGTPTLASTVTFSFSAPTSGSSAPTGNGSMPTGTAPPLPTNPAPPTDGSLQLYSEIAQTNHNKVGFPPFTNDPTPLTPTRYLAEYNWDQRSGPTPQVSASEIVIWDPETETSATTINGSIVPDMNYGGDAPTVVIEPTYYEVYGPYGNSTDSWDRTLASPYATSQLIQRTITDAPAFTGTLTTSNSPASYNLATDELSFSYAKMQYRLVSTSTQSTPLNWLIMFQPSATNPDQTVRTKAMSMTIAPASFPDTVLDPATQTFDNGSPTNRNGTYFVVPNNITRDGQLINSANNTVWVGQQINLTNMISGIPTNGVTYQWAIPGANNTTNDTAFYDYQPDAYHSNYTNLFSPTNYLTNSHVSFYWSSGGSNQVVYCTNVVYGQTNVVSATFNVSRPTDTITTPQIGTIKVDTSDSTYTPQPALYFGDTVPGTIPGITFTNAAPSASSVGTNLWVQIITGDIVTLTPPTTNFIARVGVDSGEGVIYPSQDGGLDTQDSPDMRLLSTWTNAARNFNATMYLMWQPDSSNPIINGDKTVMVPLKGYPWHWGGTATNASGTWTGPISPQYPATNAANVDVTNEPTWSTNWGFSTSPYP